ncbi:TerD family protein [Streptomyces marincola]|uniref:Stress protein n=1 Tax=Streptomyces marincola TaxID=2878388 RepID=A0A1W7CV64_9ACTN|nr:TerD family protein [Streptomyces marincola]ARQ68714.1 stress protein [Streptomyces marincola]
MVTHFQRGQKARLSDLTLGTDLYVGVQITGPGMTFDISCFGLDAHERLSDDRYFIFYNQPASPEESLRQLGAQAGDTDSFRVTLDRVPAAVDRLAFTATIDGEGTMAQIASGYLRIVAGGEEVARYSFDRSQFTSERAVMLGDFYRKDGWRFAAVGQGFDGGLAALLKHFGGEVAEEEEQTPAPAAPPAVPGFAPPGGGAPAAPGFGPPSGAAPPPAAPAPPAAPVPPPAPAPAPAAAPPPAAPPAPPAPAPFAGDAGPTRPLPVPGAHPPQPGGAFPPPGAPAGPSAPPAGYGYPPPPAPPGVPPGGAFPPPQQVPGAPPAGPGVPPGAPPGGTYPPHGYPPAPAGPGVPPGGAFPPPQPVPGAPGAPMAPGAQPAGGMLAVLEQYRGTAERRRWVQQNPQLVRADLGIDGQPVMARQGSMVLYQGDVEFGFKGGGIMRRMTTMATGQGFPSMMRCTGSGQVYLAEESARLHPVELQGDAICVASQHVLAFDESLEYEVRRIDGHGLPGGSLFALQFQGHGTLVLTTHGEPLVLPVTPMTFADANAVIAWSAAAQVLVANQVRLRRQAYPGHSGETTQLQFRGAPGNFAIIQPYEI